MELNTSLVDTSLVIKDYLKMIESFGVDKGFNDGDFKHIYTNEINKKHFLSVIMRTQGQRLFAMEQALTCLLAQSDQDFCLMICIHNQIENDETNNQVVELLQTFPGSLTQRTNIFSVVGGKRGVPMNVGIDLSNSDYVVFLDDDDLVTAEWVGTFKATQIDVPGTITRNRCVDRIVSKTQNNKYCPQLTKSDWLVSRSNDFRYIESLERNSSPLHSYAIPLDQIKKCGTFVDTTYDVAEDWDYLMRNAAISGVTSQPATTAIYNRWDSDGSSLHLHDEDTWSGIHKSAIDKLTSNPALITAVEVKELYSLLATMYQLNDLVSMVKQNDGFGTIHEKMNKLNRLELYMDMKIKDEFDNKPIKQSNLKRIQNISYRIVRKLKKALRL